MNDIAIFVRGVIDPISIWLNPTNTVAELKAQIRDKTGVPSNTQLLTLTPRNKFMDRDDLLLVDYGVQNLSTIKLSLRYRPIHECDTNLACLRDFASKPAPKRGEYGEPPAEASFYHCLEEKNDFDKTDSNGKTALMIAAESNNVDCLTALLYHGASIKAVDKQGQTALFCGAIGASVGAVMVLLEAGSMISHTDKRGRTVLDVATHGEINTIICTEIAYRNDLPDVLRKGIGGALPHPCIDIIVHYLNLEGKQAEHWTNATSVNSPSKSSTASVSSESATSSASRSGTRRTSNHAKAESNKKARSHDDYGIFWS